MLSILCDRLTIKVKVRIPESFKVGWYPPKKTGSSHLKKNFGSSGSFNISTSARSAHAIRIIIIIIIIVIIIIIIIIIIIKTCSQRL